MATSVVYNSYTDIVKLKVYSDMLKVRMYGGVLHHVVSKGISRSLVGHGDIVGSVLSVDRGSRRYVDHTLGTQGISD